MTGPLPVGATVTATRGPTAGRRGGRCTLVILGAAGDLTSRKLMPALFHLLRDGLLDDDFTILGVGREGLSDEAFRQRVASAVLGEGGGAGSDADLWRRFAPSLFYVAGDLAAPGTFDAVAQRLRLLEQASPVPRGRLFYLALPPRVYGTAVEGLSRSGAAPRRDDPTDPRWVRLIVEKPFGRSLATAQDLNRVLASAFAEHQVYRIDHYLGKETVQNLLVLRFANSLFEPVWNRAHIHHVQITAAETLGVGHRAGYYEEAGVVRDMFQNHLLQLLALTAMEPPGTFEADAVRHEKAKVLNAIRPVSPGELPDLAVRGQYGPGRIAQKQVPGYREEERVSPQSVTPTYAAIRFMIDNWRWQGVPFFLRSGKRLARTATEIAIQFRRPPHLMFPLPEGEVLAPNVLAIRIQPDEGLSLRFEIKVPGMGVRLTSVRMDFGYTGSFGASSHSAYETLLLDCLAGDPMLFTRDDETEAAWRAVDPIVAGWDADEAAGFPNYQAGSWGPMAADELIARAGAAWRT